MKKLLPVAILLAIAAFWGFFSNQKSIPIQKAKEEIATTNKVEQPDQVEPVKQELPPGVKMETQPVAVEQVPQTVSADDLPPLPANPYADFMKSVQPNANNLDSINNKELKDEQVMRRNEYFEKLSQQLKELQGQNEENNQPPPEQETADPLVQEEVVDGNFEEPIAMPEVDYEQDQANTAE